MVVLGRRSQRRTDCCQPRPRIQQLREQSSITEFVTCHDPMSAQESKRPEASKAGEIAVYEISEPFGA